METNRINKRDINNRPIGYWDHDNNKCNHYLNDNFELNNNLEVSSRIGYYFNNFWQCHYLGNGNEIGCERNHNRQYFFNKPGQKFGEQIEWKWK